MKRPTDDQIQIARMWLEGNEGESDECNACMAVANWLAHEQRERWIKSEARKHGVSPAKFRRAVDDALDQAKK